MAVDVSSPLRPLCQGHKGALSGLGEGRVRNFEKRKSVKTRVWGAATGLRICPRGFLDTGNRSPLLPGPFDPT